MIEIFAIAATLFAGSGWHLYLKTSRAYRKLQFDYQIVKAMERAAQAKTDRQADAIGGLQGRMERIADQETPSANATVKRMAAIARRDA